MKAIVVGGGIGGATLVRSLLHHGIEVAAYEQAPEFKEIGAGLQLSPPVVRYLRELGLGNQLDTMGIPAQRIAMYDLRTNRPIYTVPLGDGALERFGDPFLQLHRPDLLDMLTTGLPEGVLHLDSRATHFVEGADSVSLHFESGEVVEGDLLIGADGIHSMVRDQLLGEMNPNFSHIVAWRALIPAEKARHLNLPEDSAVWFGPGRSAVAYYVHNRQLVNFIGMVPSDEVEDESWTTQGDVRALRRSFEGSTKSVMDIIDLIDDAFITGYFFRYPLPFWSRGRVTLLGDAAHPMHPFLAQGACQAIEDAAVLGLVLAKEGREEIPAALKKYESLRLPRASKVQNSARTQEHLWHMDDLRETRERHGMFSTMMEIDPNAETVFGWVFRYSPEEIVEGAGVDRNPLERPESQRAWDMYATMFKPTDLGRQQHGLREAFDRFLTENFQPAAGVAIEECEIGGVTCVRNRSEDATSESPVVLHLHGGGYMIGSAKASTGLTSRMAKEIGGEVYGVEYRLAPEHPFPAALEDALAAYTGLINEGVSADRIYIGGESSGGGLAVALVMYLRSLGLTPPAGLIAMSPMADMAVTGESVDATAGLDPIGLSVGPSTRILLTQMAANYLQGHDPKDPYPSPVYGSMADFPRTLIQVASNEAVYSDAERLRDIARRDGVDLTFSAYDDSVHVFPIFDFLPESKTAIEEIAGFIKS